MPSLSAEQRRAIAFHALTIYEIVDAAATMPSSSEIETTAEAARTLQAWNQVFSPADREAFAQRLRWDGLDGSSVARALSAGTSDDARAVPAWFDPRPDDWTIWLDAILEEAPPVARELAGASPVEAGYFPPGDEPPFVEFGIPIVRAARNVLLQIHPDAYAPFGDAARRALERSLLRDVLLYAERTLYALFEQLANADQPGIAAGERLGSDRYRGFVLSLLADELPALFTAYPVLARVLARIVEGWVETTGELARRIGDDRSLIARDFGDGRDAGQVVALAPALSDPHHGRRRVVALTFDTGLRLIYKPRDVGVEHALSTFLAAMNERGLDPSQAVLRVLARDGYGWVEHAEHGAFETVDEVHEYYRRAGGLMAIAHLLRATDLHMENVVATARGPVLVDPESMLQPGRPRAHESRPGLESEVQACVATGLLTFAEIGADGERFETGGLRGTGRRGSARSRRVWTGLRTDALRFVEEHQFDAATSNRVLLNGVVQHPEGYRDALLDGFGATYEFLLEHRDALLATDGPLDVFSGEAVRVLFRPTNQYAVVQELLAGPKYQASGITRSYSLDVLARPFALDRSRPAAWDLFVEERSALERLDIPRFTIAAGDTMLRAGERCLGDQLFTRPGVEMVRERLRGFSDFDLAVQVKWISRSLAESATSRLGAGFSATGSPSRDADAARGAEPAPHDAGDPIAVASWIGQEFLVRAVDDGVSLRWEMSLPGAGTVGIAEHYLDVGTLGPALFLAALAHVTGEDVWADAARRAAAPACIVLEKHTLHHWPATEPLGAGTGLGSLVFSLLWIGRLLADARYTALAARVARSLDAARIREDQDLDVLSGNAGAILALLALASDGDAGWIDLAAACGDHLVATQVHTHWGAAWPSRDRRLLAGFAHGAAGIAYGLVRLFEVTGRRPYLDAALRAHRYERAVFSPVHRNWPLVRSAGHLPGNVAVLMTAWCHGAPGVALARALVRDTVIDADPDVVTDLDTALHTTAKAANAGDHLCCGNIGRSEVLLTAGLRLSRQPVVDAANAIAAAVQRNAIRRGRFQLVSPGYEHAVFDPGFLYGLAGIGYELLRVAAPSRIPSVLAFEGEVAVAAGAATRS